MSLTDDIADALIEAIDEAGEVVTIWGHSPGQVFEGDALVTGGAGSFESVSGGYYDKDTYTVSVPKTSISFMPEPGMFAEVRAKDMRIPDDGVEDLRAHWRMTVVGRSSPK